MSRTEKPQFSMLQDMSRIDEFSFNCTYDVPLRGWNLPEQFKDRITAEFREYFEDDTLTLDFLSVEEEAFTCSRYFEGQDAKDEGFSFWIDFHKGWKKGEGKCTIYEVKIHAKN